MPKAFVNGVNLYYEVTGKGFPLILGHEFCADLESWDHQVRFLQRRYQVITYNARGWPPSDVPSSPSDYSWEHGVEDMYQLLRHLDINVEKPELFNWSLLDFLTSVDAESW